MTFTHCDDFKHHFLDLQRHTIDETRYYQVDDQLMYPSVTSVISYINRAKFADWRQRVGQEEANRKTKHATTRGTRLHKVWEVYLQNGDYKSLPEWEIPLIQMMFQASKFYLDTRLDNIYHQETPMSSDRLCLAGTVDLICEVDGELSIVDFKTSAKEKPEEWLEDYFVQLSAYWAMFSERTGVVPKKLVVFLVGENGDVQIVERRHIMKYLMTLRDYANQFVEHRDAGTK
jgi:hypothetical protein